MADKSDFSKENGELVYQILHEVGTGIPFTTLVKCVAEIKNLAINKVKGDIKKIVDRGVKYGYLTKERNRYKCNGSGSRISSPEGPKAEMSITIENKTSRSSNGSNKNKISKIRKGVQHKELFFDPLQKSNITSVPLTKASCAPAATSRRVNNTTRGCYVPGNDLSENEETFAPERRSSPPRCDKPASRGIFKQEPPANCSARRASRAAEMRRQSRTRLARSHALKLARNRALSRSRSIALSRKRSRQRSLARSRARREALRRARLRNKRRNTRRTVRRPVRRTIRRPVKRRPVRSRTRRVRTVRRCP